MTKPNKDITNMNIQFATCDKRYALEFLKTGYPDSEVTEKMNYEEQQDHYVDATRYAMMNVPRLKWYQKLWNWIKRLFK